jgi:hypothetical protein
VSIENLSADALFADFTYISDEETVKAIKRRCVSQGAIPAIEMAPEGSFCSGKWVFHSLYRMSGTSRKDVAALFDRPDETASDVYFIRMIPDGPIKIGIAGNVNMRLDNLQTATPHLLEVIGVILGGGRSLELKLHRQFSQLHIRGEWFHPGDDLLAFISKEAKHV